MHTACVIGFGNMGSKWAAAIDAHPDWSLVAVCERDPARCSPAAMQFPDARITDNESEVLDAEDIEVGVLCTLADRRPDQIRRCLATGKHVIAEKPIASSVAAEEALLPEIEQSDRLVAVNLFNRNAWYHHAIREFIDEGEIGKLGILRISHMTPGRLPGDGHEYEGPSFHDCGMHYVDVARWYAGSEFEQWHAQGVRMWSEPEPSWVAVHGTFQNGIAFEITQGFVYGQMAKDWVMRCYFEALGTRGIARFHHNGQNVHLEMHGVNRTIRKDGPYGGKKLDVMIDTFARSLETGRNLGLPAAADAVVASRISQQMHDAAAEAGPPCIGTGEEMQFIAANKPTWE
jgi:myo-inositol 2-dehydrogenase/D-chiro-inositol 1-dehydrogenase